MMAKELSSVSVSAVELPSSHMALTLSSMDRRTRLGGHMTLLYYHGLAS